MVENVEKRDRYGVVFIGSEGSGKSKHAIELARELGFPYVSTGQLLRDISNPENKTPLADKVRKMFEDGAYLDGDVLLEIIGERLSEEDTINGFVLDGSLRTVEESVAFQETLESVDRDMPLTVLYLSIPVWESFDRLITGSHPRQRKDDTKILLSSRLSKFLYRFKDRVDIVKNNPNWTLIRIDSTGPKEDVHAAIKGIFDTKGDKVPTL